MAKSRSTAAYPRFPGQNDAQHLGLRWEQRIRIVKKVPRWHAAKMMLADPTSSATPPKLPPLGRLVQPEVVADLVAFLLGPSGCAITGQRLVICAGASL